MARKLIKSKVEGLSEFKSNLTAYLNAQKRVTDTAIGQGVQDIASDARGKCKAQSIASTIATAKDGTKWTITTSGVISAYLEFGTGNFAKALLANYPADWLALARNFYVSGLGRMPAQPYLFPAFQQNKRELIEKVAQAIESI